ncbi:MAG: ABC transporter [Bacteroidetes bacterium CG18_big_fil_WC_8_21_14_2_50_41_14]|nr:MAG: ABC transporter [Bacteroidetes bacterium CG18_big_fil_WC_8_21_14_2_50_41_14]PJB55436.1 MAG: ABC transporter [Bacteroidetes bacterium CG_4_9_14_3_um_filter_41_19]
MTDYQLIKENLSISLTSIKSHLLRTILTVMIIAFGIMALVGILTAIDAVEYFLNNNFAMMGANTFNIQNRDLHVHIGGSNNRPKEYTEISYQQALEFKKEYHFPVTTSVFTYGTGIATLKYQSVKTNPNVQVMGVDENYLATAGLEIDKGRNFNLTEIEEGSAVALLGSEVAKTLFKDKENPIGQVVSIGAGKFKVIGVIKERGSSVGFSGDRNCMAPLTNVRQYFSRPNMNFRISVMVTDPNLMDAAIGEATGVFRRIRKDKVGQDDSFSIIKSDNIASMLIKLTGSIQIGATLIGLITLLGAAIGLMNIMLVSVTERTREIGIRKAMGARRKTIRNQFLAEAVVIAQIGGVLGVVAGILVGNIVSIATGSAFIIPWAWIALGIGLCFIVALLSGIIPANKAAGLDPIESLRYE